MPHKSENKIDWDAYADSVFWRQKMEELLSKMLNMTGRELYNEPSYSLTARYLIDRPVSFALHRAQVNYPVKPIEIMTDCLVDGSVFLFVEDPTLIRIEEFVTNAKWNPITDILEFVEIKYLFTNSAGEKLFHVEHWIRDEEGAIQTIFKPATQDADPTLWIPNEIIEWPVFPIVGIRWISGISFLEPLKECVVRLEAAYRVIAAENVERMGLQLYIEGVRSADDIKAAPRRLGRRVHILPKDAKFHSPDPDAPGMELMIHELDKLEHALEKASGIVSTETLASLSGISRLIAERPLIIIADEVRSRFTMGMTEASEIAISMKSGTEKLQISYKSLRNIDDTDKHLRLLDKAIEKEAITPEEEVRELRMLLDLHIDPVQAG